jgi:hypothetical protein
MGSAVRVAAQGSEGVSVIADGRGPIRCVPFRTNLGTPGDVCGVALTVMIGEVIAKTRAF